MPREINHLIDECPAGLNAAERLGWTHAKAWKRYIEERKQINTQVEADVIGKRIYFSRNGVIRSGIVRYVTYEGDYVYAYGVLERLNGKLSSSLSRLTNLLSARRIETP